MILALQGVPGLHLILNTYREIGFLRGVTSLALASVPQKEWCIT